METKSEKFKQKIEFEIEIHNIRNVEEALNSINDMYFFSHDIYISDDDMEFLIEKVKEKVGVELDDEILKEYVKQAYANILSVEYQDKAFNYLLDKINTAINSVELPFMFEFIEQHIDSIVVKITANRRELREFLIREYYSEEEYYDRFGVCEEEYDNLWSELESEIIDNIHKLGFILEFFDYYGHEQYVSNLDDVVDETITLLEIDSMIKIKR